ncbi:MAG: aminopeptidase [Clostridia bacterium]|nr:aminopeptidase [Clostridia bacterium]
MYKKIAWKEYTPEVLEQLESFSADYRRFLDLGKTERECVLQAVTTAEKAGFRDMDALIGSGARLQPGDRVYRNWMGKCFMAFIVGKKPMERGMNILGAHIDSPRLDIKQNPVFEDQGLAYLDTHYYGGIKKYQWLALPLAIHGVVVKKNGEKVNVVIGEDPADPVFCITDLLPHLASEQMSKTAAKLVEGEALNLLAASRPTESEKEPVRDRLLAALKERCGLEEEDLVSAEIEVVPAGQAREMGLDRSMILGYGHDDRVCAYPSLRALADFDGVPEYTLCAVLTDKEEIGSVGATGMESLYFENTVSELLAMAEEYSGLRLRRVLQNSRMLSSDVSAGFDPAFAGVFDKNNAAFLGMGVCFNKYTGSRGKGGSSDANAEYVASIRRIMDDNGVFFQTAELGKVDAGGGGTIAYLCARYGMNVIDCGVPVLSMHAPWETVSKADVYEAYKCYRAFLKDAGE